MTSPAPIVVGSDFSAASRHAVQRARLLAAVLGSPCHAVHVVSGEGIETLRRLLGEDTGATEARLLDEARRELGALVAEAASSPAPSAEVRAGTVVAELVGSADARRAGLLVVGARGESPWREMVLGTTAERVTRKLHRPVLVVRQPCAGPYRRVLVGVDFSPAAVAAVQLATRIAPDADRTLLHAFDVPFEGKLRFASVDDDTVARYRRRAEGHAIAELETFAEAAGLGAGEARRVVVHGEPAHALVTHALETGCDLIAVGKRGKAMMEELLLGSVTKHLLAEAPIDVLVVPEGSA